jgi:hypothetical protein
MGNIRKHFDGNPGIDSSGSGHGPVAQPFEMVMNFPVPKKKKGKFLN